MTVEEALATRISALEKLLDEREDRTKERFASMKIAVDAALAAADRAVTKAETATEKRFEGVNEFRETLRDQAATLLPRGEYSVLHIALEKKVDGLSSRIEHIARKDWSTVGAYIVGAVGIVAMILTALGHGFSLTH